MGFRNWFFATVLLAGAVPVFAQTSSSQITGTVSDPSGAVIPGVNVTVVNEETGASQTQGTSGAGVFAFPALPVGRYTVSAALTGFKQEKKTGAVLVVGTPLNIDFKMEVGQATDTVNVEAQAAALETSNATLGDVVSQKAIATLPLNGRNPLNLVILQPGVIQTSTGGVNVNGSRASATNVTIDGIEANEASVPSITNNVFRLSPDNVQEFKMTTSNPTPEEGRNSGANVSIATRGGTNKVHGTLFEFFRNTDLNAADYYANARGTAKQILQLNQFGGEVGGPIIKNKTFYFGSYEGQFVQAAPPITDVFGTVYLYTPSARQGIFRYFVADPANPLVINGQKITGNSTALVNRLTGALNPGVRGCGSPTDLNCIQSFNLVANDPKHLGVDPTIAKQFASYPEPNGYSGGSPTDGLNIGNYYWNSPYRTRGPHYLIRVDHIIDSNNTIFARYTYAQQSTLGGDPNNSRPQVLPGQPPLGEVFRPAHHGVLSFRHVFSPTVVNELTAGVSRFFFNFTQGAANPDYPNIPSYSFNLPTTPYNKTPPGGRAISTPQVLDNLNIVKGSHIIRTGFNIRLYRDNDLRGQPGGDDVTPSISLSGSTRPPSGFNLPTVASGTTPGINATDSSHLQSAINDILGIPATISQRFLGDLNANTFLPFISGNNQVTLWDEGQRAKQYDLYLQDEWKPRRNLTFNYGLRWEMNPAPTEAAGRVYVPNVSIDGSQGAVTFVKADRWLKNNNLGAVGPRVGIAWSPRNSQKTVVRTGYGMSFDTISLFQLTAVAGKIPGLVTNCSSTPGGTATPGCASAPDLRISQGFPQVLPTPTLKPASYLTLPAQNRTNAPNATVMDQGMQLPTVHEWNLTIQHELPAGVIASVGYVGRRGTRLFRGYDINQINAGPVLPSFLAMQQNVNNKCRADGTGCPAGVTGLPIPVVTQGIITAATANSSTTATYLAQNAAGSFAGAIENTTLAAHLRPNQQFATITYLDSGGDSYYHSLQASARKRFDSGFLLGLAYTFGKSIDDQSVDPVGSSPGGGLSTTAGGTAADIRDWRNNRGVSDFDRKHVISVNTIYDLPFGKGKQFFGSASRPLDLLIGGWSVNGIGIYESGEPFNVLSGTYTENPTHQSRVAIPGAKPVPEVQFLSGQVGPSLFASTDGLALPAPGTIGVGRNVFRGPSYYNIDLSTAKAFTITERFRLVFRAEAFNALNHTNFTTGSVNFLSTAFGQNLSTVGTAATRNIIQTGEPGRVLQLALKLSF